jgi:hypothetical protein
MVAPQAIANHEGTRTTGDRAQKDIEVDHGYRGNISLVDPHVIMRLLAYIVLGFECVGDPCFPNRNNM